MLAAPLAGAIGLPLLFVPALRDMGEATLNNYIPVIIDPVYYAGLLLLAGAVAAIAIRLVATARIADWRRHPLAAAVAAAGVAYLAALAAFAIAWCALSGDPLDYPFNEHLMWGGGHILQFVNTILVVVAWGILARVGMRVAFEPPASIAMVSGVLGALGVLALLAYAVFPPFRDRRCRHSLGWSTAARAGRRGGAFALAARLPQPLDRRHPAIRCLLLSILVFGVGGSLGLFVDGADTRTPAHYHGVIAGVSLSLMGVFLFVLLPMLGRQPPTSRRAAWTLGLFGRGQRRLHRSVRRRRPRRPAQSRWRSPKPGRFAGLYRYDPEWDRCPDRDPRRGAFFGRLRRRCLPALARKTTPFDRARIIVR